MNDKLTLEETITLGEQVRHWWLKSSRSAENEVRCEGEVPETNPTINVLIEGTYIHATTAWCSLDSGFHYNKPYVSEEAKARAEKLYERARTGMATVAYARSIIERTQP